VEEIRKDYRGLLAEYQKIAESLAALGKDVPSGFAPKVILTADRWRRIDAESPEPSQLAGKIFHSLGLQELAWNYWTCPIDLHPAESKAWLDLANVLVSTNDLDRADRAFAQAVEAEPTNPELLWQRAQNLARMGQGDHARQLYRQIADGTWQDRFRPTVDQARPLATR
jgi:tetratricopeptide (TPR) repeat protein